MQFSYFKGQKGFIIFGQTYTKIGHCGSVHCAWKHPVVVVVVRENSIMETSFLICDLIVYMYNECHAWSSKEYRERRHGEPFKFQFLPKMGLVGSQAVIEKKSPIVNYERHFSSTFST